jgi:hypothetical protein
VSIQFDPVDTAPADEVAEDRLRPRNKAAPSRSLEAK